MSVIKISPLHRSRIFYPRSPRFTHASHSHLPIYLSELSTYLCHIPANPKLYHCFLHTLRFNHGKTLGVAYQALIFT